jgi:5-methylcytosine-specific restriction enzyme subunit McrC
MSRPPIQVFEHQTIRWDSFPGFEKDDVDAMARYLEKSPLPYYTLVYKGVKFAQYVGVIQVGNLTIEILPKADANALASDPTWQRVLLDMLKECALLNAESVSQASLRLKPHSILDLYLSLFLKEVERILHQGLVKKYRSQEGNQFTLKGRLHFAQNVHQNLIHQERFYVKYQVYDHEHLINQILYKTLRVIPLLSSSSFLLDQINRLLLSFPEQEEISVHSSTFQNIRLNRKTNHYHQALQIAELLLLNYHPDIRTGEKSVLALLFDMNRLFEEYVLRQLQKAAIGKGWTINGQQRVNFWEQQTIRPDIVASKEDFSVVLDTKWKVLKTAAPSDDDLKQMFAYNHYCKATHSILLYPRIHSLSTKEGKFINNHISLGPSTSHHSCEIRFINVVNAEKRLNKSLGAELIHYLEKLKDSPDKITDGRRLPLHLTGNEDES